MVDGLNNRIQRYTKDGRFLGQWGKGGHGPGELNLPWGIAVDGVGAVYVADWRNDRIQKFDAQGGFLASYGTSGRGDGEFSRPSGVSVDGEGNIYIADWGNERVQVLGPDGGFLAKFRGESGLSKWGESYFIANQDELEERQKADLEPELNLSPTGDLREESASIEKFFWGPIRSKWTIKAGCTSLKVAATVSRSMVKLGTDRCSHSLSRRILALPAPFPSDNPKARTTLTFVLYIFTLGPHFHASTAHRDQVSDRAPMVFTLLASIAVLFWCHISRLSRHLENLASRQQFVEATHPLAASSA